MSNRQLEEQWELEKDLKVARYIGLTAKEYASLDATLEDNASDDGLEYSTMVVFTLPIPDHIALKIENLKNDRVHLPPGFFDEDDS